jgi:hypothetical protein
MASTFCRTKSVAISAARSLRPSAQRALIAIVWLSTQPSSLNRCANLISAREERASGHDQTAVPPE